ncbi:MAG: PAS domain S-box protein [Leptolyngbyaceae cyanobacterium CRU_2_3]|nr:PAS domain S-box protein [Leptolyngbyaceae cyanobacterium CRU_2_3]
MHTDILQDEVILLRQQNAELKQQLESLQKSNSANLPGKYDQILEWIAQGKPLPVILDALALLIESQSTLEVYCCFLLLDEDGRRLRHGAAPSLPAAYNALIDGIEIGPAVGSCGTAAYHKACIIVEEIATDPLWTNFRDLALSYGLQSCWSCPILGAEGQVLATFAMYHPFCCTPTQTDRELIFKTSYLARIAIERHQAELILRRANEQLELSVTERTMQLQATVNRLEQEICDRQQAEAALQSSQSELLALFHAMQDVILVLDAEGKYLKIAPTSMPLLYRPAPELLGKTVHEVFPTVTADYFLNVIQQALADQKLIRVEYQIPVGEQEIWFEASIAPLSTNTVIWVAKDSTERRQAEEDLKRSEARFRSYFDLPLIGIAITSPERGWVSVNDQACEMLGYSREELLQRTWSELTHPEDLILDLELFQQMLTGEINQYSLEKRYFRKDGQMIYASLAIGCSRQSNGTVDYVVALMQDITDRKLAEMSLRESEQQLRAQAKREKLLNRLIRNIRSSLNFDTVLSIALQEVQLFLKVNRCYFAWYNSQAERSSWEIVQDVHDADLKSLKEILGITAIAPLSMDWFQQEVVQIADVRTDLKTIADAKLQNFFSCC